MVVELWVFDVDVEVVLVAAGVGVVELATVELAVLDWMRGDN